MAVGKTRAAGVRRGNAPGDLTNCRLSAIVKYSWFNCKGRAIVSDLYFLVSLRMGVRYPSGLSS